MFPEMVLIGFYAMKRWFPILFLAVATVFVPAAERQLEFKLDDVQQLPKPYRNALTGTGAPALWKVILDDVPPILPPITQNAPKPAQRPVLAQLSSDPVDERFPLCILDDEVFGDFTFTTRFKIVQGALEQMAGVAFRIRDVTNYYVVRASALGNNLRFYKFVDGVRSQPIGPELPIKKGHWYELSVQCVGNSIRCKLDGKQVIPTINDNSFTEGKIAFWTKSDSISHFTDGSLVYTPREPLAKNLVREALRRYPRLLGLKVYSRTRDKQDLHVVAAADDKDIGKLAGDAEKDVVANDHIYYGKEKSAVIVTLPMRDRNGEAVAAVTVTMQSFFGQTEQNAIARALPILKLMESRIRSASDLAE